MATLNGGFRATVLTTPLEMDLSLPEAIPMLFDHVVERLGVLSILINNAAYSLEGTLDEIDAPRLDAHYAVNVRATALFCAEFARRFRAATGELSI